MNRNKAEYKIFGVRRSGMHAVIYWLAKHYENRVWFANDLASFNNPREHREELAETYEPEEYISPIEVKSFWECAKPVLISSCEDSDLSGLDWEANERVVGSSDSYFSVLVIRDPFNAFASRCRIGMVLNEESRERWKQHAREALGETSFLKNKVVVKYNRWFGDESYRRCVENEMRLGVSDDGMQRVYGLGSSFTGKERDGEASKMCVGDRYKHYLGNEVYMNFFDAEMIRMAWTLFGGVPGPFAERAM